MKVKCINLLLSGFLLTSCATVHAGHNNSACFVITGEGQTQFDAEQNAFVGTAMVTLNGTEYDAEVSTLVFGVGEVEEDGTLHSTTSHRIALSGLHNSPHFVTFDQTLILPTEDPLVSKLTNVAEVPGTGTGRFNNKWGTLVMQGQTTNAEVEPGVILPVAVDFTMFGRLCRN